MPRLFFVSCSQQPKSFEGPVTINGTDIFVKTIGKGDPIIVVHGGPGLSHDYFLPHFEKLAENNFLIFYDQRGTGRSSIDQPVDSMNFTTFANDIEALRNYFKIDQFHLLSHSWGAMVASEYVLMYPSNVASLLFSNPIPLSSAYGSALNEIQHARMDSSFLSKRQSIIESQAFQNGELQAYEKIFKLSFSLSFANKQQVDDINLNLNENFNATNQLLQHFQGMETYDYLSDFQSVSIPALVIHGAHDLTVLEADEKLVSAFTDGKLAKMKAGHFPFIELRDDYSNVINSFLNELD